MCGSNPYAMKEQVFETQVWLPRSREEIFPFFADAGNLDAITPPWLHFRILTPLPLEMRQGAKIHYQIRLHGIPISWRTNIASWNPSHSFVDEQISGPYQKWHHTHLFEEKGGGTLCKDRVVYKHLGGMLVHKYLVRPDIERIFAYRQEKMLEIFAPVPDKISAAPSRSPALAHA